jgi:hypothetical protein
MPTILQIELSDETAEPMREAARSSGETLEQWAIRQLRRTAPTLREREDAILRLKRHIVDAPQAVGSDNESIERDLAREYASTHEER